MSEAERKWSTLAVQFATRLSLLYEILDRSSPSRVRFAAQQQRALDCCGPFQETPLSKRERLKTERDQSAANLDLFFTATDNERSKNQVDSGPRWLHFGVSQHTFEPCPQVPNLLARARRLVFSLA